MRIILPRRSHPGAGIFWISHSKQLRVRKGRFQRMLGAKQLKPFRRASKFGEVLGRSLNLQGYCEEGLRDVQGEHKSIEVLF